ncbi:Adenylate cyclase 1 [Polystyrenella longa]|uniref:Adenylate cyclase 1 n=1 Tax=Polystyrenella longa TaxID=2528007 RepID=A0A518CMC2_9PLAN|nr:adenylate/guanylate cyclase domain-containing protein [Polystyrenella longa]QDU80381.1 Adenylate cyclase 1 [Polystyrenella longa]
MSISSSSLPPSRRRGTHLPEWFYKHPVLVTGVSIFIPQLIGSCFNIAYNAVHVERLLTTDQLGLFYKTVAIYNVMVYPAALIVWCCLLRYVRRTYLQILSGEMLETHELETARRVVINLPWYGSGYGALGWFLCIPVFLGSLASHETPLDPRVYALLPISFAVSGLIASTHSFFILEMLAQKLLYPVFFQQGSPSNTSGARPLSLRARGLLWVLSAGVCPIISLLLLRLAPQQEPEFPWFEISVGVIGIVFGLTTAWLGGRWITRPVEDLRDASRQVSEGNLEARVDLLRADEFGPLIDEFNHMVTGLREKERVEETFGRHVGKQAARMILEGDLGARGFETQVTMMFVDIRSFTSRCESTSPQKIVELLNRFLTEMVEIVESSGGMVNKFLGDGFMAIFGLTSQPEVQQKEAVEAGQKMLARLIELNEQLKAEGTVPLEIGIGLHSGPAIVGSIGSPRRMEFTVIGDTVNVASRVESLTKQLQSPFLITNATREGLNKEFLCTPHPPQEVRGQSEHLVVWSVTLD